LKLETRTTGGWRMPTYYFHVRDNGTLIRDPDGIELPQISSTEGKIRNFLISVLREEYAGEVSANREFQIEDAFGRIVLIIPFQTAHIPASSPVDCRRRSSFGRFRMCS